MKLRRTVCKKKRIHNGCSMRIENSVTRNNISVRHYSASRTFTLIRDGIFNQHLTIIKDSYIRGNRIVRRIDHNDQEQRGRRRNTDSNHNDVENSERRDTQRSENRSDISANDRRNSQIYHGRGNRGHDNIRRSNRSRRSRGYNRMGRSFEQQDV